MNSSDLALLKAYIPLKKYTDDIAADILYILNDRFDRYKNYLDEFPYIQMKAAISDLAPIVNRIDGCSNAFRVYMFTDFQRALFTGIDFGDSDIWKIIGYINDKMSDCPKRFRVKPEYVSTIYIFKDNSLFFVHDIFAAELSEISANYRKHDIMLHKMK